MDANEQRIAAVRLGLEGNRIGIGLQEETDAVVSFAEIVVRWRAEQARVEAQHRALQSIAALAHDFYRQGPPRDGKPAFLAALSIAKDALARAALSAGQKEQQ